MTAFVIATIHLNLCIGTIARFAEGRSDLMPILEDLRQFKVCGEFMLTELEHGLDAKNLDTTAAMLDDGSFLLHSPAFGAAKAMPPTTPLAGFPRIAVVFAQLLVKGERRGVKPFIVTINDSTRMRPGIVSRALPIRPGTKPLDHAITMFNNVRLPAEALLGPSTKAEDERAGFLDQIWRVSVGTLSLSIMGISALKVAGCIAAVYGERRQVGAGNRGQVVPILSFSTQQRPILKALAYGEVLHAYAQWTVREFMNPDNAADVRRGLATAFKALVVRSSRLLVELAERCGWQGLFSYNQISELASTFQGNSIAEGDTLVISIRSRTGLASELLAQKYCLPSPSDRTSSLAKYEIGVFQGMSERVATMVGGHRSDEFNATVLPRCRAMVEAIGQRMAYEAALHSNNVAPEVLDLFEICCIQEDPSWYVEHCNDTRARIWETEDKAFRNMLPLLPGLVDKVNAADYITSPIVDGRTLETFILALPTFGNEGRVTRNPSREQKL
ncbi:putative acyl-CoA oxidase [Colletotrichum somersetense]|nr:putative acyl-CoA oxidase [Colletotrichum somersetense]